MGKTKIDHQSELKSRIYGLLKKKETCDVVFMVGDPPQEYPCHKAILAAASQVFEAMFYGGIPEKGQIHLPDVTANGFRNMLEYVYSDEFRAEQLSNVFETAYVAKKYMIERLFHICETYLLKTFHPNSNNVYSVYEEASFLEMEKLQKICLRYVSRNARNLLHSKNFAYISRNTLKDILQLDWMDIDSESDIAQALWLWGQEKCKKNGYHCSSENIRTYTNDFLKYIRFLSMTYEEIDALLKKFELLDTDDQMAILLWIAMPTNHDSKMPSQFCKISRTRSLTNCTKIDFPVEHRYDGNLSTFSIKERCKELTITVKGCSLVIVGVVVTLRTIPCYSSADTFFDLKLEAKNLFTKSKSNAKVFLKPNKGNFETEVEVLFDDFLAISEGEAAVVMMHFKGDGVRLTSLNHDDLVADFKEGNAMFYFSYNNNDPVFPISKIMCI